MMPSLIIANWKMNRRVSEALQLAKELKTRLSSIKKVRMIVCPPIISMETVASVFAGSPVELGAQDMFWEDQGAFTGEVSPLMIKEFCQYVILGHSERRQVLSETDEMVNLKIKAALRHNITPVLCVGESLETKEQHRTVAFLQKEIKLSLEGLTSEELARIVVAYEPIWAIGTGKVALPHEASDTISKLRDVLAQLSNREAAEKIPMLYGGSVNSENSASLLAEKEIQGLLVGSASLNAVEFSQICEIASKTK